jgi:hypothetical protein
MRVPQLLASGETMRMAQLLAFGETTWVGLSTGPGHSRATTSVAIAWATRDSISAGGTSVGTTIGVRVGHGVAVGCGVGVGHGVAVGR